MSKRMVRVLLGAVLSLIATATFASKYNMPVGVSAISRDIYDLHMIVFYICVAIGVLVFGVLFYSLFKYRKSKGAVAAQFHEHPLVEMIWAVIPFIILLVMAIPATKVILEMHDTQDSDVTIKIMGYQWKWQYSYLDQGIQFFSNLATPQDQIQNKAPKGKWYLLEVDNPVVVPIHKKIRFLITSNDVIHSWWVPDLGVKKDALPGFIHEAWTRIDKAGTYRGQCTELCGRNHAYMPIVVKAVPQKEFDAWVNAQRSKNAAAKKASDKTWTKAELMEKGKGDYVKYCAVCHKADGSGMPPAFPALKDSKVAKGPLTGHLKMVLDGVKGTAMQAFGNQLSNSDIAAIVTYERNAWGNNMGDLAQPADVQKARGSE